MAFGFKKSPGAGIGKTFSFYRPHGRFGKQRVWMNPNFIICYAVVAVIEFAGFGSVNIFLFVAGKLNRCKIVLRQKVDYILQSGCNAMAINNQGDCCLIVPGCFLMYGTLKEFFPRHTTLLFTTNPVKVTGKQYNLYTTSYNANLHRCRYGKSVIVLNYPAFYIDVKIRI